MNSIKEKESNQNNRMRIKLLIQESSERDGQHAKKRDGEGALWLGGGGRFNPT